MNHHLKLSKLGCSRDHARFSPFFFLCSLWPTFSTPEPLRAYSKIHAPGKKLWESRNARLWAQRWMLLESKGEGRSRGCPVAFGAARKLHRKGSGSCQTGQEVTRVRGLQLGPPAQQPAVSQCNCFLSEPICSALENTAKTAHFLKECPFHKMYIAALDLEKNEQTIS